MFLLEADAEVREQVEAARLVGQLSLVDDDPGVGAALLDRLEDLVEGHDDRLELPDVAAGEEGRRGARTGDGDPASGQVFELPLLLADDHGAIPLTHAGSGRHDPVAVRHRKVGVRRDRGDWQFAGERPVVQALDVLEDMFHPVVADAHRALREGAEHEGVVGVGAVPDPQDG